MTPSAFFAAYASAARRSCLGTGLLPSICLAQAALESNWGDSYLSKHHRNFGGIKAGKSWKGAVVLLPTKEWVKGKYITVKAAFRAYPDAEAYFRDRLRLFQVNQRYQQLFKVDDYRAEAKAMQASGYATDPLYGQKLAAIVTKYQLTGYDC